jgi:predicted DNA-binding transcriptional regulator AlpA
MADAPVVYMSLGEIATRLGVATGAVAGYRLPPPDALIGKTRGWLPATVDEWVASRPGRGNWGPRKRPEDCPAS